MSSYHADIITASLLFVDCFKESDPIAVFGDSEGRIYSYGVTSLSETVFKGHFDKINALSVYDNLSTVYLIR